MTSSNDGSLEEHNLKTNGVDTTLIEPDSSLSPKTTEALQISCPESELQSSQTHHTETASLPLERHKTPDLEQSRELPLSEIHILMADPETPVTSLQQHILIDPEEECTICYSPLTTPCILIPCNHLFDKTCFLAWFDLHLSEIDTLYDRPPDDEILICPFCKQSIDSLTEITSQSPISRDSGYIFTEALNMRSARGDLNPED